MEEIEKVDPPKSDQASSQAFFRISSDLHCGTVAGNSTSASEGFYDHLICPAGGFWRFHELPVAQRFGPVRARVKNFKVFDWFVNSQTSTVG